jgi:hypothetical protein
LFLKAWDFFDGFYDTQKRALFAIPVAMFASGKWHWQAGLQQSGK